MASSTDAMGNFAVRVQGVVGLNFGSNRFCGLGLKVSEERGIAKSWFL